MNKTITIIVIAFVVVVGAYFLLRGGYQTTQESGTDTPSIGVLEPGLESVPETNVAPGEEGGLSVQKVNISYGNLFFNPQNLILKKDKSVRITLEGSGTHTFTIDELGVNVPLRGGSGVVEFTPTKTGAFQYYCAVPGHREGGMFGSLTVE